VRSSSPEGRYTKISALAALVGLVLAYLPWQYPKVSSTSSVNPVEEARTSDSTAGAPGPTTDSPGTPGLPPTTEAHKLDSAFDNSDSPGQPGVSDGDHPPPRPPVGEESPRACASIESATLRVGRPAKVASGLASLSISPGRMGSEPFVTLGIRSDRGAQPQREAVLGAPSHYSFETSRGRFFVDVTEVDFATNTLVVEVGCESGGTAR